MKKMVRGTMFEKEVNRISHAISCASGVDLLVDGDDWVGRFGFTATEDRIFDILHRNLGRTVCYDRIMNAMWFDRPEHYAKTLQVFVCRMRKKLSGSEFQIETLFGIGLKLIEVRT